MRRQPARAALAVATAAALAMAGCGSGEKDASNGDAGPGTPSAVAGSAASTGEVTAGVSGVIPDAADAAQPSMTTPTTVSSSPTSAAPESVPTTRPGTTSPGSTASLGTITPPHTTPAPAPRTVSILGAGDELLHPQLWQQARADADSADAGTTGSGSTDTDTAANTYDFDPIFARVADDITSVDVAICEMETPVGDLGGPFSGWPRFNVPPQVLGSLQRVGYDSCTTASNHTLDQGAAGVTRTLDAMDAVGLEHTGSARTEQEAATPLIVTTDNGVRVGQLAYTFSFNGLHRPAGQEWLANLIDIDDILAAAKRLKAAGADIVVLSLHWGIEYQHLASDQQKRQAAALLASPDIDLILGDHPHVIQPMQNIDGKWVIYSMGNQVARHADPVPATRQGVMPVFTFTEQPDGTFSATDVRAVPTWMQLEPRLRLIDLPRALANPNLPTDTRAEYCDTARQIGEYLDAYGEDIPLGRATVADPGRELAATCGW